MSASTPDFNKQEEPLNGSQTSFPSIATSVLVQPSQNQALPM